MDPEFETQENPESVPGDAQSAQGSAAGVASRGTVPPFFSREAPEQGDIHEVEPGDSMSAFISKTIAAVAEAEPEDDKELLPRAPRSFMDVGLSKAFLTDLTLKIIHYSGTPSMSQLVRRLALNNDIVSQLVTSLSEDRLIEVIGQSDLYTGNYRYRLSERGQGRVKEALERTRYAGPTPVTAEQYSEVMRRVLSRPLDEGSRAHVKAVLNELVLDPEVADAIARALFSGKPALFHGPSGNGKTVLLEHYAKDTTGFTIVPYAVYAYGQVIRLFDQSIHQAVEAVSDTGKDESKRDRRWVVIKRPAIMLGAEMDAETMELAWDPSSRFYQAPPHLKAQNGTLIVDDFGRQRIDTHQLLTRWLIPVERGWDSLTLVTGEKLTFPFEVQPLLATNTPVNELADDALLRRILYKVKVTRPTREAFGEILRRECLSRKVKVEEGALDHVLEVMYSYPGIEPRGSHARDILEILIQSAGYDGKEPVLDKPSFDRIFKLFLASEGDES
jgi:predicted ATPase with chaperone activity